MNVYDFDGTIYDGDSTVDFFLFCIKRKPRILSCIAKQMGAIFRYKAGKITKTEMKELFFCFLKKIDNTDCIVKEFWVKKRNKIKEFYLAQHRKDDVIISASPQFLLEEICKILEIRTLIASNVDIHTGSFYGDNCYGETKLIRFREMFGEEKIDNFYTDSKSDFPLARIASHTFLVKGKRIFQSSLKSTM